MSKGEIFNKLSLYFRDERTAWWLRRRVHATATVERLKTILYGDRSTDATEDINDNYCKE